MGVVYEEPRTWAPSGEQAEWGWACVSQGATVGRHATGHRTQPRFRHSGLLCLRLGGSRLPLLALLSRALGSLWPFTALFCFLSAYLGRLCCWPAHSCSIFQLTSLVCVQAWTAPRALGLNCPQEPHPGPPHLPLLPSILGRSSYRGTTLPTTGCAPVALESPPPTPKS